MGRVESGQPSSYEVSLTSSLAMLRKPQKLQKTRALLQNVLQLVSDFSKILSRTNVLLHLLQTRLAPKIQA